jgi:hypothetical protein
MLLHGFSYTICDFATNKTEKNTKYHKNFKTNTELSKFTDNTRLSNDDKTQKNHGLDYFTETKFLKAPNYLEQ